MLTSLTKRLTRWLLRRPRSCQPVTRPEPAWPTKPGLVVIDDPIPADYDPHSAASRALRDEVYDYFVQERRNPPSRSRGGSI